MTRSAIPSAACTNILFRRVRGSYDGIFGLTVNGNWNRYFLDAQIQYYLRSEGRSGFKYGNELMVSGGPGIFILLDRAYTLSLQALS